MVTIALPSGVGPPELKSAPVMGNSSGVLTDGGMGNVGIGVTVDVISTTVGVGLDGRAVAVGVSGVLVDVGSTNVAVAVVVGTCVSVGTSGVLVCVGSFGVSVGSSVSVGVGSVPPVQ